VSRGLIAAVDTPAELRAFLRACEKAGPEARARLCQLARQDEDALVTRHAVRALGRLGRVDPAVTERLDDSRRAVRHAAIRALAASRDASALPHLAPLLEEEDATARRLAIHALGQVGGPQAVAWLDDGGAGVLAGAILHHRSGSNQRFGGLLDSSAFTAPPRGAANCMMRINHPARAAW